MSTPAETDKTATMPESPTTARPLELDDDDTQESGISQDPPGTAKAAGSDNTGSVPPRDSSLGATAGMTNVPLDDAPPPKPPRPMTEAQKNELILKEAFPSVETGVVKAVLRASGGKVEPAFNALLEMTDPDAARANDEEEEQPPPQPPRPVGGSNLSQLEADEQYARQLAEHYERSGAYDQRQHQHHRGTGGQQDPHPGQRRRQATGLKPNELYDDREHSFLDDDLPVIKENLKKGFMETQTKVNSWITNLKKKIDDAMEEEEEERRQQQQQQQAGMAYGRRPGEASRRSGDYERYDADPHVITDDFAGMKLSADGTPIRDNRPLANPNLYQPPPPPSKSPKPNDGRRVAFAETTEDIDDAYTSSPKLGARDLPGAGSNGNTGGSKASKWQPLSPVEPNPIADNDPFSLGDSEDEKDVKDKAAPKDGKGDGDAERLRKAAAEAMNDSLVESKPKDGSTS